MNSYLAPKISSYCVTNLRNSGVITCDSRLEKFVRNKFSRQPRRGEAQGSVEYSEYFASQSTAPMNKSELP